VIACPAGDRPSLILRGRLFRLGWRGLTWEATFLSDRNIVFLFGAGASFGAGHVLPESPPLGPSLYDALAAKYPKVWGPESHAGRYWGTHLRNDFEKTMADMVLPHVPSLSLLEWHRCVAEFFAAYNLDQTGQDCYSTLLSGLKSSGLLDRIFFATLNYDCLLEQAVARLEFNVNYILDDLGLHHAVPLAKIHGSCNFVSVDLQDSRALLTNSYASSLECEFRALPLQNLEDQLRGRFDGYKQAFYPVLSLYSPYKPSILAPGKIENLRNAFADRVKRASVVVLIGVRPNRQADWHLWEPIEQSLAREILYVGGPPEFAALKGIQGRAIHSAEKFEAGVAPILNALSGDLIGG
jgi:hypothetical protein